MRALLGILLLTAACTFDPRGSALDEDPVGPGTEDPMPDAAAAPEVDAEPPALVAQCRVDGELLGVDGLVVEIQDASVVIARWIPRDGRPDEYIGFELSERVPFEVRAGDRTFIDDATDWLHPDGDDGDAPRISRIEFCDVGDGRGGDGPGGD